MLESLGLPSGRIFLTPYVVDNDFFARGAAAADRAAVRARWDVPAGAFVALFVGKLVRWKRPLDLVEALAMIPDERVRAVFVGEGELREGLCARARELGIAHRTHFVGFQNQTALPAAYAASDVLVLPFAHEPFGLVVNEAFCCGIPAIVSEACGAAGDLVRDGETGYVIPVGDVGALATRLKELAADAAVRARLAAHARARMEAWSPEANADAFAKACQVLAQRCGRRRRRARGAVRA
jgi:glycosyltransferase involved in cell wall biosynthesis